MVRWLSRKQPRTRTTLTNRLNTLRRKLWLQHLEDRAVPATFTVNVGTDDVSGMGGSGLFGDLRYCITQANLTPGADTIVFSVSSITLNSLEIQITDSLTIDGGASLVTINGSGARIFNVDDAQAARQISVTMNKLELANASTTLSGGAITVANEFLTVTNSVIRDSSANNGGGIAATGRKGKLNVFNTTFLNNQALGFTAGNGDGGALTILSSAGATAVHVSGCTFIGNKAVRTGGAIMLGDTPTGYTFLIENSTFTQNEVNNTEGKTGLASRGGGAICVNGDTGPGGGIIRNCTIVGNKSSDDGGGIEIGFTRFIGDLLIQNCTIMNNEAGSLAGNVGGGIYQSISTGGIVTIDSCIVSGNVAGPGEAQDIFSLMPIRIKNSAVGDIGSGASSSGMTHMIDLGGNLAFGANLFMSTMLSGPNPQVLLPLPGSPVVNAGSPTGLPATDQRGLPRVGQPDIGAVELQTPPATPWAVATTPDQFDAGGGTYSVTVRYFNGAAPIDVSTINNGDVTVKDQFAIPLAPVVAPPAVTPFAGGVQVVYTFVAPGNVVIGAWDETDNGLYTVELQPGAVTDTAATAVPAGQIGRFEALLRQVIIVDNPTDFPMVGMTSLREAIDKANTNVARSRDIIRFAPALDGVPIVLGTNTEILITDTVIIEGRGTTKTIIDGDLVGGTNRIFNISGNGLANTFISGLTLTGGSGVKGAAIYTVSDPVSLTNVVVSGNSGSAGAIAAGINGQYGNTISISDSTISNNTSFTTSVFGGGFNFARSLLIMNNSVVTGNVATNSGGGFYGVNSRIKISNSTWSNNEATGTGAQTRGGGAIFLYANIAADIDNSTISGNFAMFSGGAAVFRPTTFYNSLNIRNSTVTGNRANSLTPGSGAIGFSNGAGGISVLNINSPLNIESSVIAGNIAPFHKDIASPGTINLKNSVLGSTDGVGIINNQGGNLLNIDPRLGALANNGGSVPTHLPGPGSPLINAGSNPTGQAFDQRGVGFPRVVGPAADIGAVESTGTNPVVFRENFPDMNTFGGTTHRIQVRFADDVGMNPATIIGNNNAIRVTSPLENYNKLATFVSYNALTGVAEYDIPAAVNASLFPVIWDGSDNGIYTVSIEPNQVADSGGTFVAPGVIGTIRVRILEVNNPGDSGPGTLRQAILDANAFRGPDTIVFNLPGSQTITLASEIAISDSLVIQGTGKGNLTITHASTTNRFFSINDGVTGLYTPVTISGITFLGGNTGGDASVTTNRGGAIILPGDDSLTLRDCDFINNFAPAGGGAVALNGANAFLTIERCLFEGNGASTATLQNGGALRLTTNTTTVITDSTFRNNTASRGGAISGLYAALVINNSTISGNFATTSDPAAAFDTVGGGLDLTGTIPSFTGIVIRNSTISGNVASTANTARSANAGGINLNLQGHVFIQNSTVTNNTALTTTAGTGAGGITVSNNAILTLESTIVSGNFQNFHSGSAEAAPDMSASGAFSRVFVKSSLIGIATSKFNFIDQGNNLIGSTATPINAMLNGLANNGGLTETHTLMAGSPAIDAGSNPASLTLDQRGSGFPRVNGPRIDIGAVESNASNAPVAVATLPAAVTAAGPGAFTVTVDYFDNVGLDSTTVDSTDLKAAGPGGYSEASAVAANIIINTPTLIRVEYVFSGPGGGWTNANNGDVSITLNAVGAVTDGTTPVTTVDRIIGRRPIAIGKVFTVTSNLDAGTDTLRAHITSSNASVGTDTIVFNGPMTIALASTLPQITDSLVIMGFADPTQVVIDGGGAVRLFDINSRGVTTVTFDGLTLTNGKLSTGTLSGAAINLIDDVVIINNSIISNNEVTGAGTGDANGGAINISGGGAVNITKSVLIGNKASSTGGDGGAIFALRNASSISITNSTLSGNSAGRSGGAIYMAVGGNLFIDGTTLSGNTVLSRGGAVYFGSRVGPGGFTIRNSTISGNSATGGTNTTFGGGVFLSASFNGTAVFQNSTITGNTIPSTSTTPGFGGGGIGRLYGGNAGTGNIYLESTIVAGNTQTGAVGGFPDISSLTPVTAVNSLVGVLDRVGFAMNSTGLLGGSATVPLDARLAPLALNGAPAGSPLTHALLPDSPAIDKGSNPAGLLFDQRGMGFNRKSGAAVDIGAYEVQVAGVPPQVATIKYNGGDAQRSMLQSIEITFSEAVTIMNPANAFTFVRYDKGAPGSVGLTVNHVGNSVTITFNNSGTIALDPNSSVPDGQYELTIVADQVVGPGGTLDGNKNGISESNAIDSVTSKVHRLFGDADGNGGVTATDFNAFRLVYGTAGPSIFDFDGVGGVSASDFNQFRLRYGLTGYLP